MRTFRFVYDNHKEHDYEGWRLESQPGFDPVGGLGVAHDILEHFPGGDSSPADEFMALGAALIIRGDQGYWHQRTPFNPHPHKHVASDFPEILSHVVWGDMDLADPGRTKPVEDYDYLIIDTIKEARRLLNSEYEEDERARYVKLLWPALGWMRRGMRKAMARYRGQRMDWALYTFIGIEKEVNRITKDAQLGDKIEVRVDVKNGSWDVVGAGCEYDVVRRQVYGS